MCSKEVKETACTTHVRPCLEYASGIWDPYQLYLICDIDIIQRRVARWTFLDYNNSESNILTLTYPVILTREVTVSLTSFYALQNLT